MNLKYCQLVILELSLSEILDFSVQVNFICEIVDLFVAYFDWCRSAEVSHSTSGSIPDCPDERFILQFELLFALLNN
jgi:hypothetical protein